MFIILKNIVGTNMTDEKLKKVIKNTFETCNTLTPGLDNQNNNPSSGIDWQ